MIRGSIAIMLPFLLLIPALLHADGPVQNAVRVEKGPELDGRLIDEAWSKAVPFTGFKQIFPSPDGEPSERTELRIIYDRDHLYIGVFCYDSEPSRIAGNSMAHDGSGASRESPTDDLVRVLLDPFQDKRNAYLFVVNPRGARSEGLAFGEHFSLNWDGIWDARSRIQEDGWSAEIEIPFKTISFNPELDGLGHQRRALHRPQAGDHPAGRHPARRLLQQRRRGRAARGHRRRQAGPGDHLPALRHGRRPEGPCGRPPEPTGRSTAASTSTRTSPRTSSAPSATTPISPRPRSTSAAST